MINNLLQVYNSYEYNIKIIEQIKEIINKHKITKEDISKVNKLLKEYHI